MLDAGAVAPDFSLPDLNGKTWKLSEAIKTGPVLLAFFKVSCPTCQFTFPFLSRISGVVAVSQDDAADTRAFGPTMPTVFDAGPGYTVSNQYGITHVPSLFLVEQDGRISKAFYGFDKAELTSLGVVFRPEEQVPGIKPG